MSIENVIAGIQNLVRAVPGIRAAPDVVSEQPAPGVFAIAYPANGTIIGGDPAGEMKSLHNISLEIIAPRTAKLRAVLEELYPFCKSVPIALEEDPTLGSNCDTFGSISYTFNFASPMYGSDYMGWLFTIHDVKTKDAYTPS